MWNRGALRPSGNRRNSNKLTKLDGHVQWMPEERLPKQVFTWTPQARIRRRMPRKSWRQRTDKTIRERGFFWCSYNTFVLVERIVKWETLRISQARDEVQTGSSSRRDTDREKKPTRQVVGSRLFYSHSKESDSSCFCYRPPTEMSRTALCETLP